MVEAATFTVTSILFAGVWFAMRADRDKWKESSEAWKWKYLEVCKHSYGVYQREVEASNESREEINSLTEQLQRAKSRLNTLEKRLADLDALEEQYNADHEAIVEGRAISRMMFCETA